MAECGLPYIEAIEGELVLDCLLCQTVPKPQFNPNVPLPPPPSFDFGCYPFSYKVDFDPTPSTPVFEVTLTYLNASQVGYCKPRLNFKVRMGGGNGCGNIETTVLADHNIVLSGCQTIDGVFVCDDDRVLTIAQTDGKDNDVWTVKSGAWERYETTLMCNTVLIRLGDKHARELWQMDNKTEPVHGTDRILWSPLTSPIPCRLRLTDSTVVRSGTKTVDGKSTMEGDFIAVDVGLAAPSTFDGVWIAHASGAWTQIFSTTATGDPNIPILSPGAIITVYDGYSSPWLYVVGRNFYDAGA
jgi:hypothetical protein